MRWSGLLYCFPGNLFRFYGIDAVHCFIIQGSLAQIHRYAGRIDDPQEILFFISNGSFDVLPAFQNERIGDGRSTYEDACQKQNQNKVPQGIVPLNNEGIVTGEVLEFQAGGFWFIIPGEGVMASIWKISVRALPCALAR